jgi:hypothetical protein
MMTVLAEIGSPPRCAVIRATSFFAGRHRSVDLPSAQQSARHMADRIRDQVRRPRAALKSIIRVEV